MTSVVPSRKNLGWLWFYILLALLSILATIVLIVYNRGQQLKSEQLQAERDKWRAKGPGSYHLIYTIKANSDSGEERIDHYDVTVSDGVVTKVNVNGRWEKSERFSEYGMDKLFNLLADNQEIDRQKDRPRTFTRAIFDPNNGALLWYVRRVMGSRQRLEIAFEKLE